MTFTPGPIGGLSPFRLVTTASSAASGDVNSIAQRPTQVGVVTAFNKNAAPAYLNLYDTAAVPSLPLGGDVPVRTYMIPGNTAGAGVVVHYSQSEPAMGGLQFKNGLAMSLVTDSAPGASSGMGLGDCVIGIDWR